MVKGRSLQKHMPLLMRSRYQMRKSSSIFTKKSMSNAHSRLPQFLLVTSGVGPQPYLSRSLQVYSLVRCRGA